MRPTVSRRAANQDEVVFVRHAVPLQSGLEPFPGHRLRRLLGRGAFAEVWESEAADGTRIALKFLPAERQNTTPTELRLLQTIRQLQHPNLLVVHRVWCHLGYIVIAMEQADCTLADVAAGYQKQLGKGVGAEEACALLFQAADGLDFLNAQRHNIDGRTVAIQHCDIKPSNLMLFGGTVKLADFGLATLMTSPVLARSPCGTPAYSAPEIFHGRVSRHSDQFSLAISYCELRGGRLPFANSPRTFDAQHVHGAPDLAMLEARERPIVTRALAPAAEDRWPSCGDFIDKLARESIRTPIRV